MFKKKQDWTIKKDKDSKKEDEKTRLREKGLGGMVSDEIQGTPYGAGSFGPGRNEEEKSESKNRNLLE